MPDGQEPIAIKMLGRLDEVAAAEWDACAGADDLFLSYGLLTAPEASGSVGDESGWPPRHLVVEGAAGGLMGDTPLYLKGFSYGEYVFDWL